LLFLHCQLNPTSLYCAAENYKAQLSSGKHFTGESISPVMAHYKYYWSQRSPAVADNGARLTRVL